MRAVARKRNLLEKNEEEMLGVRLDEKDGLERRERGRWFALPWERVRSVGVSKGLLTVRKQWSRNGSGCVSSSPPTCGLIRISAAQGEEEVCPSNWAACTTSCRIRDSGWRELDVIILLHERGDTANRYSKGMFQELFKFLRGRDNLFCLILLLSDWKYFMEIGNVYY